MSGQPRRESQTERSFGQALREIASGSWLVSLLAVVTALLLGGILIAAADSEVQTTAGYFFARPSDFFSAVWAVVSNAYISLFQGAVLAPPGDGGFVRMITPLTDTLTASVPLIFAGLGLSIGFRAGLFNVGGQGQIVFGAIFCAWVSFALSLPAGLHVLVAVLAAAAGGAVWGFIPGFLKARTGANEVIVTIMLNSVAVYFVSYLLTLKSWQRPDSNNPISPIVEASALYPKIFGPRFTTHLGFVLAVLAAVGVWWLMERSTLGFKFRAVGANPQAARTAGINVNAAFIWVMVISGALAGLAASAQVIGTEKVLTAGVAATFGFDAITVALLGRSKPLGTLLAGLLFGGLRAGGYLMQAQTGTPIDVILVVQSVIVLLIAAPPLVRAIFRLPKPGAAAKPKAKTAGRKEAVA
ncbi:MAG: ABC transporter permease [Bifidobacteriaceae bacterium]|nr:ABC transporter permease [Bifidobacteriaceae bacterium]